MARSSYRQQALKSASANSKSRRILTTSRIAISETQDERYRPSQPTGIPDWDKKREAFATFFRTYGDKQLVQKIVGEKGDTYVASVVQSFKHYYKGKPTKHGYYFDRLAEEMNKVLKQEGYDVAIGGRMLVDCTYRELCALVPAARRIGWPPVGESVGDQSLSGQTEVQEMQEIDALDHPVWVSRVALLETAREGLNRGRVDQKVYYLNPDAADHWKNLISSEQYQQYDECKAALRDLTTRSIWSTFFTAGGNDGVVMLGGGSPTKDLVLIQSLLGLVSRSSTIHYALVDISHYMLLSAFRLVESALRQTNVRDRVQLTTLGWDFMNLHGAHRRLRRAGKNVVWVLPGGTIGNLDESHFFSSIKSKAVSGDLVVIGAETTGGKDVKTIKATLLHKYEHPAFRNFVMAPLRAVWHDLGIAGPIEKALKEVQIDIVDGFANGHSRVNGAVSVEVSIVLEGRKVVLLTSTRYNETTFADFVESHGFVQKDSIPSPLNAEFKQLVFYRP